MSDGYGHSFSLSLSVIPRYLRILSFTYSADPGLTTKGLANKYNIYDQG